MLVKENWKRKRGSKTPVTEFIRSLPQEDWLWTEMFNRNFPSGQISIQSPLEIMMESYDLLVKYKKTNYCFSLIVEQ